MKTIKVALCFMVIVAVNRAAVAQGTGHPPPPPPPCADRICQDLVMVGGILPASFQPSTAADTGASVTISDDTLRAMGISRTEFVDRVSAGFFPGLAVDLLISTTELADPLLTELGRLRSGSDRPVEAAGGAVALEIRRIYQIPRSRADAGLIDRTDEIVVTDGRTWVTVRFRRSSAVAGDSPSMR